MNRILKICSALLCLIMSSPVTAQQKYPKTLLWRISGKGLQKPSYLYGTMHLTDKRIFNFGDSVYHAIEQCEGLAIELNPDEMAAYLINEAINEAESKNLSEILDDKDYHRYGAALSKKFKKPAREITTADVVKEKNRWVTEFLENGEMPTFVDAWLYNFARKQGKWVGGVEDMADQDGLMEDLVDRSDIDYLLAGDSIIRESATHELNNMLEVYINQDLDQIDLIMNTDYGRSRDLMLIKRNLKMARRIDSLMAFRTMFVAVGAAHLPGDSGVIDLLKARGFNVEPVFSKQKIDAQTYPVKTINIPWQSYEDENKLYSISMPGNPASVKVYSIIEMKFHLDMTTMSAYSSMAVVNTHTTTNKDSLLLTLAKSMLRQQKVAPPKKVIVDGVEGCEFVKNEKGEYVRLQAFMVDKVVYVTFMYALKKEGINSADANKFFASLTINKNLPATTQNIRFTDSVMGLSFTAPVAFMHNAKMSFDNQNNWKITCFNGSSPSLGAYIALYSKEVMPGYHLPGDSVVQGTTLDYFNTVSTHVRHGYKTIQGEPALTFVGQNKEQEGVFYRGVSFIRHNKNILFLVISDSSHLFSPDIEQMFTSLRWITPNVTWKVHTTPDKAVSAWTPAPFQTVEMSASNSFPSFDTTTAISYMVLADTLSRYSWYASDSSYWNETIKSYSGEDSVVSQSAFQQGAHTGKEVVLVSAMDSTVYTRIRFVLADSILYRVTVTAKKELAYHANSDRFLKEFILHTKPGTTNFHTTSKAGRLLDDLAGTDSLARIKAWQHFNDAPFEEKEIPLLRKALFRFYRSPYFDNDTVSYVNNKIADKLIELGDTMAVDFVRAQYPLLTGSKDKLKNAALTLLAGLHTRGSYNTLAELVQTPPKDGLDYSIFSGLRDTLLLTASIYPSLQKLFKDSANICGVALLTFILRDSGLLSKDQLAGYESEILKAAVRILPDVKRKEAYIAGVTGMVQLLGSFKTTAANQVLQRYLATGDDYVRLEVVTQLAANKQPVPVSVLTKLAADPLMRTSLYRALKTLKRTSLFPKQYLTQAHFALAALYDNNGDEDYPIAKVTFIATKTAVHKGNKYVFYLYKVQYESDDDAPEAYLGIAGGFLPGSKALEPAEDLTGMYWEKPFDAKTVNADLKDFLKEDETP